MKPRKSSGRMASKGQPNPIDIYIGDRIRRRRVAMGISQERLAEAIGLTFQQIQKYERGANRVSASRLWDFAEALDTVVSWFFEDMPPSVIAQSPSKLLHGSGTVRIAELPAPDPATSREALELTRDYMTLPPEIRAKFRNLIRITADELARLEAKQHRAQAAE